MLLNVQSHCGKDAVDTEVDGVGERVDTAVNAPVSNIKEVSGVEERVDIDVVDALREHDFITTLNEGHPVVPYVIVPTMAEVSAQRKPPWQMTATHPATK